MWVCVYMCVYIYIYMHIYIYIYIYVHISIHVHISICKYFYFPHCFIHGLILSEKCSVRLEVESVCMGMCVRAWVCVCV